MFGDILDYLLETVDKPGRAVRGAIGGRPDELAALIPFSDSLGLSDPSRAISGEQLATQAFGSTGSEFGDALMGLGVGIATDPTTYVGLGPLTRMLKGATGAMRSAPKSWTVAANVIPEERVAWEMGQLGPLKSDDFYREGSLGPNAFNDTLGPNRLPSTIANEADASVFQSAMMPKDRLAQEMFHVQPPAGGPITSPDPFAQPNLGEEMFRLGYQPGTPGIGLFGSTSPFVDTLRETDSFGTAIREHGAAWDRTLERLKPVADTHGGVPAGWWPLLDLRRGELNLLRGGEPGTAGALSLAGLPKASEAAYKDVLNRQYDDIVALLGRTGTEATFNDPTFGVTHRRLGESREAIDSLARGFTNPLDPKAVDNAVKFFTGASGLPETSGMAAAAKNMAGRGQALQADEILALRARSLLDDLEDPEALRLRFEEPGQAPGVLGELITWAKDANVQPQFIRQALKKPQAKRLADLMQEADFDEFSRPGMMIAPELREALDAFMGTTQVRRRPDWWELPGDPGGELHPGFRASFRPPGGDVVRDFSQLGDVFADATASPPILPLTRADAPSTVGDLKSLRDQFGVFEGYRPVGREFFSGPIAPGTPGHRALQDWTGGITKMNNAAGMYFGAPEKVAYINPAFTGQAANTRRHEVMHGLIDAARRGGEADKIPGIVGRLSARLPGPEADNSFLKGLGAILEEAAAHGAQGRGFSEQLANMKHFFTDPWTVDAYSKQQFERFSPLAAAMYRNARYVPELAGTAGAGSLAGIMLGGAFPGES